LLLSLSFKSIFLLVIMSLSLFLTTIYCIWLFNRMCFGITQKNIIMKYRDLIKFEIIVLSIFTILIIYFGIYPNSILNLYHDIIYYNINKYVLFIPSNYL
jgi:NADH-quinone oxidoreductase subunit M